MPDDRNVVRKVAWAELFPWLLLLRTLRLSLDLRKLILAALGIVLTAAGWWSLAAALGVSDETVPARNAIADYRIWPWNHWHDAPSPPWDLDVGSQERASTWQTANPLLDPWRRLADPARRLMRTGLSLRETACYAACALWAILVWAWFGGAITRIAAVELTREERLGWKAAFRHVHPRWRAYLAAPLLPIVGVLVGIAVLLPLGLLMRLDWGAVATAVVWPIALLVSLVLAILLVGLAFGWPLMWASISAEGMDSWDANSRAYAYVYQRPLNYLFYAAVASLLGALGWLFVSAFASLVIHLGAWGVSWGSGEERLAHVLLATPYDDLSWAGLPLDAYPADFAGERDRPEAFAGALIRGWWSLVKVLALGFAYSYFWTASTGIYLLLRKDTDNTPLDDVCFDEGEETFALPPLTDAADGVPVVADTVVADTAEPPAAASPQTPPSDAPQAS